MFYVQHLYTSVYLVSSVEYLCSHWILTDKRVWKDGGHHLSQHLCRFKAGQPLEDGALRLLEQLPGISHQVWMAKWEDGEGRGKDGGERHSTFGEEVRGFGLDGGLVGWFLNILMVDLLIGSNFASSSCDKWVSSFLVVVYYCLWLMVDCWLLLIVDCWLLLFLFLFLPSLFRFQRSNLDPRRPFGDRGRLDVGAEFQGFLELLQSTLLWGWGFDGWKWWNTLYRLHGGSFIERYLSKSKTPFG